MQAIKIIVDVVYFFIAPFKSPGGRGGGFGRGGGGFGRGGGGFGRGGGRGGMRGGKKVVIEPHRHDGVFIARGKEDALVTRNMVSGEAVYGEKRISVEEVSTVVMAIVIMW